MAERLILTLVNGFALLMILIMQIVNPKVTCKTILFGVKVPKDALYCKEVQKLHEEYDKIIKIIGGVFLIILSILVYYFHNIKVQLLSIFLYIGILFLIYLRTNSKAKKLKREKNWDTLDSKVVIVDKKESLEFKTKGQDDLWKIGNTIYCNPKDPSIFIKKRYGTGWTINVGRPLGIALFLIVLFGLIIGIMKLIKL